jgi:hypothetical protein
VSSPDFATAVDRLIRRIGHWEQSRWAAPVGTGSKGDVLYALVQRLADLGARAEGRPPREVPRLGDLILPDQLRVVADDLNDAPGAADVLDRAIEDLEEAGRAL